jgi:tripartite-type tricarboxylate transporter receptor subunit TctC
MKKISIALFLSMLCSAALAKDIKLIVPLAPGGSSDKVARVIQNHFANSKYTFAVEYRLGAGGVVAFDHLATVKNETVFLVGSVSLVASFLAGQDIKYNVAQDFILVDYIGAEPMIMVVRNDGTVSNFKDFERVSKNQLMPVGMSGVGTTNGLAATIIARGNKNIDQIPYKGLSPILTDLLGGNIKWTVDSDLTLSGFIDSNKIRPIAVISTNRLKKYPTVPTLLEVGIDDLGLRRWHVLIANRAADPEIVSFVQQKLSEASVRAEFQNFGFETPSVDLATFFQRETLKVKRIMGNIKSH